MAKITVKDTEIVLYKKEQNDYISLTDMAKHKNPDATGYVISRWLSARYMIDFMGIWERVHNPDFNVVEFNNIKSESGSTGYVLTTKQWIERTNATGITARPGRYNSGTYAHKDIAFEFASWISAEFKFYLIQEFQRLKEEEQKSVGWSAKRELAKINYHIHTSATCLNPDFNKIIPFTLIYLENHINLENQGSDNKYGKYQRRFYQRGTAAKRPFTETQCDCHSANERIAGS